MSTANIDASEFVVRTSKTEDGYTVKLTRKGKPLPSASLTLDDETVATVASTRKCTQEQALTYLADVLVSTFFGERT